MSLNLDASTAAKLTRKMTPVKPKTNTPSKIYCFLHPLKFYHLCGRFSEIHILSILKTLVTARRNHSSIYTIDAKSVLNMPNLNYHIASIKFFIKDIWM